MRAGKRRVDIAGSCVAVVFAEAHSLLEICFAVATKCEQKKLTEVVLSRVVGSSCGAVGTI